MIAVQTGVAGIRVPSSDPVFLTVVGLHVLFALVCAVTGIVAMLSNKRPGRHPTFGTIYYWCLSAVFVSATVLSVTRWTEDYPLFILGALSYASATFGRAARRRQWRNWLPMHISGMGVSYILLVTAFYVDNGKALPLWRESADPRLLARARRGRGAAHPARTHAASVVTVIVTIAA